MLTLLLAQFAAGIQGTNSEAMSDFLENLQRTLEYCIEENSVLKEVLELQNPGKRIRLSSEQKRRLAQKAINLKKDLLADVTDLYRPETILGWHRPITLRGKQPSKSTQTTMCACSSHNYAKLAYPLTGKQSKKTPPGQ